jgi:hypothetical protein
MILIEGLDPDKKLKILEKLSASNKHNSTTTIIGKINN